LLICTAVPLILFSCAATKIGWYVYPAFPFLAVLLGTFLHFIIISLKEIMPARSLFVICLSVFIYFAVLEIRYIKKVSEHTRQTDPVQRVLFINSDRLGSFQGAPVYLENGKWEQRFVLTAKLVAGLLPTDGGRTAWEKDASGKAILITRELDLYDQKGKLLSESNSR
jgi:hypothetical protein